MCSWSIYLSIVVVIAIFLSEIETVRIVVKREDSFERFSLRPETVSQLDEKIVQKISNFRPCSLPENSDKNAYYPDYPQCSDGSCPICDPISPEIVQYYKLQNYPQDSNKPGSASNKPNRPNQSRPGSNKPSGGFKPPGYVPNNPSGGLKPPGYVPNNPSGGFNPPGYVSNKPSGGFKPPGYVSNKPIDQGNPESNKPIYENDIEYNSPASNKPGIIIDYNNGYNFNSNVYGVNEGNQANYSTLNPYQSQYQVPGYNYYNGDSANYQNSDYNYGQASYGIPSYSIPSNCPKNEPMLPEDCSKQTVNHPPAMPFMCPTPQEVPNQGVPLGIIASYLAEGGYCKKISHCQVSLSELTMRLSLLEDKLRTIKKSETRLKIYADIIAQIQSKLKDDPIGKAGRPGTPGYIGMRGQRGRRGPKGVCVKLGKEELRQGPPGPEGPKGAPGTPGDKLCNCDGVIGDPGVMGTDAPGLRGPKGFKGEMGPTGKNTDVVTN